MPHTFPRQARLLTAADYARVFKRNVRVANREWTALARYSAGEPSRLGLAIAKKRVKRAVDRNRIKRVARESFRLQRASLQGYEVVVMAKDPAGKCTSAELRCSIDKLWSQLQQRRDAVA